MTDNARRMRSLTDLEREKYQRAWKHIGYREESPAFRNLESILRELQPPKSARLADLGSGTCLAAKVLMESGYSVECVDIASNANQFTDIDVNVTPLHLWQPRGVVDYAYCIDVMEHLPQALVSATLANIARNVQRSVYFRIAYFADHWGPQVLNDHLHLTVRPRAWWQREMEQHWRHVHGLTIADPHHKQPIHEFLCYHAPEVAFPNEAVGVL